MKDCSRKYVAQKHSPLQEKAWAKLLGGRVTPGSGNQNTKGDVRIKGIMRLEMKCTEKKSFSLTREMAEKIEQAGLSCDEIPAMEIEFLSPTGKILNKVAIVPVYVLEMLVSNELLR